MSKILNRPMFRGGGKVSSYGNGITSGLADGGSVNDSKRGLVDGPGGYAGEYTRFRDYNLSNPGSPVYTGASIKAGLSGSSTPFLKLRDRAGLAGTNAFNKYIGNTIENIPNRFGNFFYGEDNAIKPNIDMTMDEYRDKLPSYTTTGFDTLDNVLGFGEGQSPKRLKPDEILPEATRLSQLLIPQKGEDDYRVEEDLSISPEDIMRDNKKRNREIDNITKDISTGDAEKLLSGIIDTRSPELSNKEKMKQSKAMYKEMLSGDKSARIADLSDWALSLFEKSTKEGATVKSMLGDVAGEIAAKPSRTESLDRDSSKLAIQDMMMTKKAAADAEAFKGKTDYQYKLKNYYDQIGSDPTRLPWGTNKKLVAKAMGGKRLDNINVIKGALEEKTRSNVEIINDVTMFTNPASLELLDIGFYIINAKGKEPEVVEVLIKDGEKTYESRKNQYY